MGTWFFTSDLHGQLSRYDKLFRAITSEKPSAVLLGGDLLPQAGSLINPLVSGDFIPAVLLPGFARLREQLSDDYPRVCLIMGNDDPQVEESWLARGEAQGLWCYIHNRSVQQDGFTIFGYACVPPTPFLLKDWERYDVSRYVDPGCISPEEGWRTIPMPKEVIRYTTIQSELEELTRQADMANSIFLFHAPPHQTNLDRAALDGKMVDSAPLDVHVGSIAIRRFIQVRRPWITLHGHVHESPRMTGTWRERIGRTYVFSAAHDGEELPLIRFDPARPEAARRELV
jgi:Icc-related predicted phosphoesterase